jgi:hypothetical protein
MVAMDLHAFLALVSLAPKVGAIVICVVVFSLVARRISRSRKPAPVFKKPDQAVGF